MLASQIRKEYLTPKEINDIVSSSGLTTITPFLLDVLTKSRDKKISPVGLLELQGKIAEKIIRCEKQIAIFKKTADREKRNDEWRSREIYKAHRKMLKEVMDGVAFRLLHFERPVLRQLAHHNQTGHLTEGFIEELTRAEYIVNKTGFYVILNDLTNFLRYGDLTIISPEGIMIDEVKTSGSAKGNQKKALDEIIKMLNEKVFKIGSQTAQYIKIPGKPTNFVNQVEVIINKSKQNSGGIFAERLSPYLWVSSISIPKMMSYFKETGKLPGHPVMPFPLHETFPSTNSLMFFDQFSPNLMPYPVFPFSEEIICEIMTGQIQLKVVVSERELIRSFKGKGWELTLPSREAIIAVYDTDDIDKIKEAVVDPRFFNTLRKGDFSYKIPREELLRIESEFRSVKSFIDESEGLMKASVDRISRMMTTNFSDEHLIWR